jgi:phosphoglucomutase
VYTGNEIGILLASWVWQKFAAAHPDVPANKCAMLNTTVSSKMLSAMAEKEGFYYDVRTSLQSHYNNASLQQTRR